MSEVKSVNCQIAEALGWSEIEPVPIVAGMPGRESGQDDGGDWCLVPDYAHDLNALVDALPVELELRLFVAPLAFAADIIDDTHEPAAICSGEGYDFAEAAAEAFLVWLNWKAKR